MISHKYSHYVLRVNLNKYKITMSSTNISSDFPDIVLSQQEKLVNLTNEHEDYFRIITDLSTFTRKAEYDLS